MNKRHFLKTGLVTALVVMLTAMVSSIAQAEAIGKIKNASTEDVRQALTDTIAATEAALTALKSGAGEEVVQEHISAARQSVKRVEINRLDVIRTRSSEKLKNARAALKKGDKNEAASQLAAALEGYQEMSRLF